MYNDLIITCSNQSEPIVNPFSFNFTDFSKITTDPDNDIVHLADHNTSAVFTVTPQEFLVSKKKSTAKKTLESLQFQIVGIPPSFFDKKAPHAQHVNSVLACIKPYVFDQATRYLHQLQCFLLVEYDNNFKLGSGFLDSFCFKDPEDKNTSVFTVLSEDGNWLMDERFAARYNAAE